MLNATFAGFSFLFTKVALSYAGPIDVLMYRFVVSFAALSIPVALGKVKLRYPGKPLYKVVLLATMYPLAFFSLQAFGLKHATSAEGGILYAFTPVMTMVLASFFLHERTNALQKLSIFLSIFGVMSIFVANGLGIDLANTTGVILLFAAYVAFAGYTVLARSLVKVYSPVEITYLLLGIGFVTFTAVSLADHAIAGTLDLLLAPLASRTFVISILYLGILASLMTALTATYALSKIGAAKVSVFNNLSALISVVAGALFLGEEITLYHVIGAVLIIGGVAGTNLLGRDRAPEQMLDTERATT